MPFPVGVTMIPLTWGKGVDTVGNGVKATLTIKAVFAGTAFVIWEATGDPFLPIQDAQSSDENFTGVVNVPATDQNGWVDSTGAAFKNWSYSATIRYQSPDNQSITIVRAFQVLSSQTAGIDLDILPTGTVGAPVSGPIGVVTSFNGETGAIVFDGGGGGTELTDADIAAFISNESSDTNHALDAKYAPVGVTGNVTAVQGQTGDVALTLDDIPSGTANKVFTVALLAKLNAIQALATANDTDANLKNRANHTGTQLASTISDFTSQVNSLISAIVGAAPGTLDTLLEIDNAIGNDPNFATTMSTALATKVAATRTVNGHALTTDVVVTKADVSLGNADNTSDANKPVSTAQAAADAAVLAAVVALTGNQTVAGIKTFSSSPIVPVPTTSTQVAQKAQVDVKTGQTVYNFGTGAYPNRSDDLSTHGELWLGPTAPPAASAVAHGALPRDTWRVVTS